MTRARRGKVNDFAPRRIDWRRTVPEGGGYLSWAGAIHRYVEPRDWRREMVHVPAEFHDAVEKYLREILQRMRVSREAKAGLASRAADGDMFDHGMTEAHA
jgi:hypothetical protein